MADFVGQKRAFWISVIILLSSIPIALVIAFIKDNFMFGIYTVGGASFLCYFLFFPNWPWLNMNPPEWKTDVEFYKLEYGIDVQIDPLTTPGAPTEINMLQLPTAASNSKVVKKGGRRR